MVDTDIASYVLAGREEAIDYLSALQSRGHRIYFSEVTRAELLSTPGLTDDRIKEIEELMGSADEIIEVDRVIAEFAGSLRRLNNSGNVAVPCMSCGRRLGGKLRMADAFIAATAISEGATLVTNNGTDYAHLAEKGLLVVVNPTKSSSVSKEASGD